MDALTITYAAAIIAAAVAVVQIAIPNILVLIMTAFLKDEHSAATWSVVGRSIGNSDWPVLLRSDMVTSTAIPHRVNAIVYLRPIILGLAAIAAVVTPLGLYETTKLADGPISTSFIYLADSGPFGVATKPRSEIGFSRFCGGVRPFQCPGTENLIIYEDGDGWLNTTMPDGYDRRIPQASVELYQSGLRTQAKTVSSFFDIHSRFYREATDPDLDNRTVLLDIYSDSASVIESSGLQLVEGLVVDTIRGRVGFRNHSAPVGTHVPLGAEWEEDILFLEPETSCADLNITLDFELKDIQTGKVLRSMVDKGGFVDSPRQNPFPSQGPQYGDDLQTAPSLDERSYRLAWALNRLNMYFMNISQPSTNLSYVASSMGQRFEINNTIDLSAATLDALKFVPLWTYLLDVPLTSWDYENSTMSLNNSATFEDPYFQSKYTNPWHISSDNYSYFDDWCRGTQKTDIPSTNTIDAHCGIVVGAAISRDPPGSVMTNVTHWSCPLQTCASATKAVVRTVRFRYNQTVALGLERLSVLSISEKSYTSADQEPFWGVESANTTIANVAPFWGLIDPQLTKSANLSSLQGQHLYLPYSSTSYWKLYLSNANFGHDYLPAINGPTQIWESAYQGGGTGGVPDYTGVQRKSVANKWKSIGYDAASTSKIMNLIWTDLAAVYFVGSRGLHSDGSLPPNLVQTHISKHRRDSDESTTVDVYAYERVVRFRWIYGIPAFLCLLLTGSLCLVALYYVAVGKGTAARVKYFLWKLSAGRILAQAVYPDAGNHTASTQRWVDEVGGKYIAIRVDERIGSGYAGNEEETVMVVPKK